MKKNLSILEIISSFIDYQVKTLKMHLYTGLQILGLVILWVVKSSTLALAFPFFVVGMVPYRLTFKLFFNPRELEAVSWQFWNANLPISGLKLLILFAAWWKACWSSCDRGRKHSKSWSIVLKFVWNADHTTEIKGSMPKIIITGSWIQNWISFVVVKSNEIFCFKS